MDVYVLADPRDGGIRYVGISKNFRRRVREHCLPSTPSKRISNGRFCDWKDELLGQGLLPDAFQIGTDMNLGDAQTMEKGYIKTFRESREPMLNVLDGGTYGNNHSPSAETRARLRAANLGKKMSPEAIAKTRAAHLGSKRSPEICAKFAAIHKGRKPSARMMAAAILANTGRHPTPETHARLSEAQRLRNQQNPHSVETRAKIAAAHRGKKISPEHVAKLRAGYRAYYEAKHTWNPLTSDHRAKISAALLLLGRHCSPEAKAKIGAAKKAWWAAKRAEERGAE